MAKAHTNASSDVRDNIIAVGQRIMSGKGFSAVGLNEILSEAKVPKGSFYHYFDSKDAFGEALLSSYFEDYLADLDARAVLDGGTAAIIARLGAAIEGGVDEGSLAIDDTPEQVAQTLYQLWLGASVMVKIVRGTGPFDSAMAVTRHMLHLAHHE